MRIRTYLATFVVAACALCSIPGSKAQQDPARQTADPQIGSSSIAAPQDGSHSDPGSSSSLQWVESFSDQGELPDAPQAQGGDPTTPQNPVPTRHPQTKRILGIIPNFRSVSTDEKLPPQTAKQKFITTTEESFDYSSAVIPVLLAGYSMATDATPEFHQGMAGYGRYLWHSAADQTSENYLVQFVFPVITHEDSRYYTMGRGGFFKRTGYALSRAVVTRNDAGKDTFNISEIAGAGGSAGISSLYYPTRERSFSNTAGLWGINVGVDAATFVLKEFWPDINNRFFHYKEQ